MRAAGVVSEALLLDGLAVSSAATIFFQHFAILLEVRCDGYSRESPT
jgi:hypothetical protein